MAKKVLQSVNPVNPKNKAQRKEKKQAPKRVQGVSEQYEDGTEGDLATTTVTLKTFEEIVMDEGKDVILLLHIKGKSQREGCAVLCYAFEDHLMTTSCVMLSSLTKLLLTPSYKHTHTHTHTRTQRL